MSRSSLLVVAALVGAAHAQPAPSPGPPPGPPPGPAGSPSGPPGETAPRAPEPDLDALINEARAQAPSLETIAIGTLQRARRAVSIGPTVGLFATRAVGAGDLDAALTFGLGLELFDVPVLPDLSTIEALVIERAKAQVKTRLLDGLRGRPVAPFELSAMVRQIYGDVRDELLGLHGVRAKTFERPRITLALEANRLFGADRWLARFRAGIGVWRFTLSAATSYGRICRGGTCDDHAKLFLGPELVLHALVSDQPRASVVDVFLRVDLQTTGRGDPTYDQVVLGARYLLDLL